MRSQICPVTSTEPGTLPVHSKTRGQEPKLGLHGPTPLFTLLAPHVLLPGGSKRWGRAWRSAGSFHSFIHHSFVRQAM